MCEKLFFICCYSRAERECDRARERERDRARARETEEWFLSICVRTYSAYAVTQGMRQSASGREI